MATWCIIVVGASAGGVEAVQNLVAGLPAGLPAAILVVVHMSPRASGRLPHILSRSGRLPAVEAQDGEKIQPSRIYVARPDHHLLVTPEGRLVLSRSPRENHTRPAIDPLFRSAASAFGTRVIGVLLTGVLDDGTLGMRAIKNAGGTAIVQDPADAMYPEMPRRAIEAVAVDGVLPLAAIPDRLVECCETEPRGAQEPVGEQVQGGATMEITQLTCPDCGGVLTELAEGRDKMLPHYQCHLGHMYSPYALDDAQTEIVEQALWNAVRHLRERAMVCRRLVERGPGTTSFAIDLERKAKQADHDAEVIQKLLDRETQRTVEPGIGGAV